MSAEAGEGVGLRHRLEHALVRGALAALKVLPAGAATGFGRGAAKVFFGFAPSRRGILRRNIDAAFPEKSAAEKKAIGKASVENLGAAFMEFLGSSELSREDILARVELEGEENFAAARRRGKGVFLLSAHFGSWELGAIRAGLIADPISSVVRPLDNPLLEEELEFRRTRLGNRVIRKRQAAREILKALRAKETVAILVDQNVIPEEAIFVPFFGRAAATTPSLALLQLKTDAAVVPVYTWPLGGGRYRLRFEKPILAEEFAGEGEREERVRAATARYMAVTEEAIRGDPGAWLWMHNRWRTRPA
ncbi:MAG TPA: lysophospholipid acyltransferase family protein [Thermoanaerobaculia bacterium]|nr:lysophospholipid acyltransferase family protein [Thermoanaerobaculia bacterium]